MPVTTLSNAAIPGQLLKFQTVIEDEDDETIKAYVKVSISNNKLEDLSQPTVHEIYVSEEVFHKDLRKQAAEYNQLITSHSTHPEWNPEGYSKHLEE